MQKPVKALRLILCTVEGNETKTLLDDALFYCPTYQAGDIIHLLHPSCQPAQVSEDHQYVVRNVKHIITVGEADVNSSRHVLLVEMVEVFATERDELGTLPII